MYIILLYIKYIMTFNILIFYIVSKKHIINTLDYDFMHMHALEAKCQSVSDASTVLLAGLSDGVGDGQPSAGDEHAGAEHGDIIMSSSPEDDQDAGQL